MPRKKTNTYTDEDEIVVFRYGGFKDKKGKKRYHPGDTGTEDVAESKKKIRETLSGWGKLKDYSIEPKVNVEELRVKAPKPAPSQKVGRKAKPSTDMYFGDLDDVEFDSPSFDPRFDPNWVPMEDTSTPKKKRKKVSCQPEYDQIYGKSTPKKKRKKVSCLPEYFDIYGKPEPKKKRKKVSALPEALGAPNPPKNAPYPYYPGIHPPGSKKHVRGKITEWVAPDGKHYMM